jgi:hypothetical protein
MESPCIKSYEWIFVFGTNFVFVQNVTLIIFLYSFKIKYFKLTMISLIYLNSLFERSRSQAIYP